MYEHYYRFLEKPFSLTPDPKFFFLSKQHQGALEHMLYGVRQKEGFMVVTGDVGMGKTTLCRCLLEQLDPNVQVALILNPMLSDMDLLRTCLHDLGVKPLRSFQSRPAMVSTVSADENGEGVSKTRELSSSEYNWINKAPKKELIDALNAYLLKQHEEGGSTVLIIDEAQNLSLEVMEQLRILSNLETEKEKLLQIIFVGQLELNDKLNLPVLKQLNQRISIRYEIIPMTREETKNYISHRILVAGAGTSVNFTKSSFNDIYNYSQGYPRLINLVCDRALLAGYNDQIDTIGSSQVKQAIRSLLGEEEKGYFFKSFFKNQLPLILSAIFFICGLAFFFGAGIQSLPEKFFGSSQNSAAEKNRLKETPLILNSSEDETGLANPIGERIDPDSGTVGEDPNSLTQGMQGKGHYRIQVYSLSSLSQAKDSVKKLIKEGFGAYWKQVETMGQVWYVVYVGPYEDAKTARIYFNALEHTGRKPMMFAVTKSSGGGGRS